jgi:hypothetical protein
MLVKVGSIYPVQRNKLIVQVVLNGPILILAMALNPQEGVATFTYMQY